MKQVRTLVRANLAMLFFGTVTLLASGALSGCGWFRELISPEPPASETEPAVIRVRNLLLRDGRNSISIKSIDERPPTLLEFKWVVTPGPHRLDVEVEIHEDSPQVHDRSYVTKVRRNIDMNAAVGGDYIVDARKVESEVYIWVADKQTGGVVAGEAPHGNALRGFDREIEK